MSWLSKWFGNKTKDSQLAEYTLYVAENCHDCAALLEQLKGAKQTFHLVNVDQQKENPPVSIFAFPALFKNDTLVAYGMDILKILNN